MTATRIVRGATLAAVAALWVVLAYLLWKTKVPGGLRLPRLREDAVFGHGAVADARHYERFAYLLWLGSTLVGLATLAVLVRRGPRIARGLGLGTVNAGIVTGVVTIVILWAVSLPFEVAAGWWSRRHGLTVTSYAALVAELWTGLYGLVFGVFIALAVILLLAKRFPRGWWIGASLVGTAIGLAAIFLLPFLSRLGTEAPPPRLAAEIRQLELREGTGRPSVRVEDVRDQTTVANAQTSGIGPSRTVIIWDTLLDGRFSPAQVRFVVAHELAHVARRHIWRGVGWGLLIGLPSFGVAAYLTRRRGGLGNPGLIPYLLLVLTVVSIVATPFENVVSRRYEAEADWVGLGAARDPDAARGLFRNFARTGLQDPTPPLWAHLLLDTHPTLLHRIQQVEAWRQQNR